MLPQKERQSFVFYWQRADQLLFKDFEIDTNYDKIKNKI